MLLIADEADCVEDINGMFEAFNSTDLWLNNIGVGTRTWADSWYVVGTPGGIAAAVYEMILGSQYSPGVLPEQGNYQK